MRHRNHRSPPPPFVPRARRAGTAAGSLPWLRLLAPRSAAKRPGMSRPSGEQVAWRTKAAGRTIRAWALLRRAGRATGPTRLRPALAQEALELARDGVAAGKV